MTKAKAEPATVRVRLLPFHFLSRDEGDGATRQYLPGDELDVSESEAHALSDAGFVAIVVPDGAVRTRRA